MSHSHYDPAGNGGGWWPYLLILFLTGMHVALRRNRCRCVPQLCLTATFAHILVSGTGFGSRRRCRNQILWLAGAHRSALGLARQPLSAGPRGRRAQQPSSGARRARAQSRKHDGEREHSARRVLNIVV
eukprot:scaffold14015_cov112-Isochrysis_galbana.AAC.5